MRRSTSGISRETGVYRLLGSSGLALGLLCGPDTVIVRIHFRFSWGGSMRPLGAGREIRALPQGSANVVRFRRGA